MNNYICIGKILKPQALKGEVKIAPMTQDIYNYLSYEYLLVGENQTKYIVDDCRIQNNFVIVKFKEINDANTAEKLRNSPVFVETKQLKELNDNEYYIQDLIGCEVISNDKSTVFGRVIAIDNYSSADIITIEKDGKTMAFPFLESVVGDIDITTKKMFVNSEKIKDILVDEN